MQNHKSIEQLWILEHCSSHTRQQFAKLGRITAYPKNHHCLRAREKNANIFFILSGKVHIYTLTKNGSKKVLFILGKNHIANGNLTDHYNTTFCETMEPCQMYVIRREHLLSLMEQDFRLTKALLHYQERKLWRLEHQLKNTVGSIYLERKLAAKLWKLARDFGVPVPEGIEINVNLPITLLADMLGAPRETTSRICKLFMDAGLITISKKRITVTAPERMAHFYKTGDMGEESV